MSDQHHTHIHDLGHNTHIRPMTPAEREASKERERANANEQKEEKR